MMIECDIQGPVIVKALIKGNIVVIDLASKERNAYRELGDDFKYLGSGKYYSYNNVLAEDNTLMHFWKRKNNKLNI